MCKQCESKPVYELTNKRKFCERCFCRFFEKKVFKAMRKYRMFSAKDRVAVACSGGKDSMAVLHILHKIAKKGRKKITALAVEEGTEQRKKLLKKLEKYCKDSKIQLKIISFKKEYGFEGRYKSFICIRR